MTTAQWNNKEQRAAVLLKEHRKAAKELAKKKEPLSKSIGELGESLAKARKEEKLSLRQLSEKCGIPYSHIFLIEQGRVNVSVETIEKIVNSLKCRVVYKVVPK